MAYMHKETFDIVMIWENPIVKRDYFQIDDLIALPVQVLNRKGYLTEFCCSAHPFDWSHKINKAQSVGETMESYKRKNPDSSYILFKKGVSLPNLPPEFEAYKSPAVFSEDKIWIRRICDNNDDVYSFMRNITEAMEQLYKWALSLPDFKNK